MANSIFHLLSDFFERYGYWAVFFGVMLENVGLPIPGETVLLFAGFLAYQGRIHILPAIVVAIAGATVGAILGFAVGWYGGAAVVQRFLQRFPRLAKRYDDAQKTLQKYSRCGIFAARFITGLRVFAGLLAGALRIPFTTFLFFTFTGAACWALAIGSVGFLFGSSWETLMTYMGRLDRVALIVLAAGAATLFLLRWARRRKAA